MFDTGADLVLVDSTAQAIGLETKDWGDISGDGENKTHVRRAQISNLQVGEWETSSAGAAVMPSDDVKAVFGRYRLSGFIGAPLLKNMAVRLDYVHQSLTFTPANEFSYAGSGTIVPCNGYVTAAVDGLTLPFFVDTGTGQGLTIGTAAAINANLAAKYHPTLQGVADWGAGGAVRAQPARADVFRMGDIQISKPVLLLSIQRKGELSSQYGRLGYGVLSRFNVIFDEPRGRIILEKNADFGRPDTFDRSGMWIGPAGDDFKVVDVMAGGPADAAGVRAGDTILEIDGASTERLVLPLVREKLERAPVGTKVRLLLKSGGRVHEAIVTLRDLI